ncbi:MAG: tetratricopeptide repeat protein [Anaerolineae bacterium]
MTLPQEEPISKTKIILPKRRMDLFSRQRLLEILYERLDRKLIIMAAAAGYGKTSLLIDLAYHSDLPFCWLALDALDREPQRFIASLIASIAERFPGFGKRSKSLLNSMTNLDESMERLLVTLVNEIYADIHEHFVLVLDDFHVLDEDAPVLYFVNRFLQLIGENCHLVLSSRSLPELRDIPLLVAREEVGGMDFSDLAFRPEELQALLAQNRQIRLSYEDARRLVDRTEGWITGLQFTDLSSFTAGGEAFRTPQRVGVTVFDYLGQQVLEQQSAEMQEFMLRSSLLEEFDVRLCEAVLGPLYTEPPDWYRLIDTLIQKNLFTLPVGRNGQWLRYHHLFRDYLQDRFQAQWPEQVEPILRRLAEYEEQQAQWEKAYHIYNRIGDMEALASLIEHAGIPMYQHAALTLDSWLRALPPSVASSRPGLLSLRGNIEVLKGNTTEGVRLFDRAIGLYRANGHRDGLALSLVRRAGAYRTLGKYEQAIQDAEDVLQSTDSHDDLQWIHADALRVKGLSIFRQGQTREALAALQQAYDTYVRVQDQAAAPIVLMEIGVARSAIGDYSEAKAAYEKALRIWRDEGNLSHQAALLNNYGFLHQQLGEYEEAASALEEGLLCAQQSGYRRMGALISLSLGDVYAEIEDYEIAAQTYRQATELVEQLGDTFLKNYLDMALASLAVSRQDKREARVIIDRVTPAVKAGKSAYENGLLQLVSGRLEMNNGRPAKALANFREARRCFEQGEREMETIWSCVWLAAAEYETGDAAAAREDMRAAVPNPSHVNHAAVLAARQAHDCLNGIRKDAELRAHLRGLFDKVDRLDAQLPPIRRQLRRVAHTMEMPTPKLVIKAFGSGQVWANGQLLTAKDWQTQSVRELFFYFLAASRPQTREQVGGSLWPSTEEPAKFRMRFKNEIYRLRRAVGLETILFDGETYAFNEAVDHEYDVEAFEAYLRKARIAAKPAEQIGFYQRAVSLVRGKYLEDIGSSWVIPDQERLHQAFLGAAVTLAQLYHQEGQSPKAIETCQQALLHDNTYEPLYRLLMHIFVRQGDKASAVYAYKNCETILKAKLGVEPSPETKELYRSLKL